MIEVWQDIDGYENKYQISNYGRIRSVKKNIILKSMLATNGYLIICLWLLAFLGFVYHSSI